MDINVCVHVKLWRIITSLLRIRAYPIPAPYVHDYGIDISGLQQSFGQAANERKGEFIFGQHKYKFVGPPKTVDDNGQLHERMMGKVTSDFHPIKSSM